MLWRAALLLEEGSLGDAAERLARAKERLQQALRGDASDEEIAAADGRAAPGDARLHAADGRGGDPQRRPAAGRRRRRPARR